MSMGDKQGAIARSRYFAALDSIEGLADTQPRPAHVYVARLRAGKLRRLYPGMAVAATIALAATFLSQHYGGPVMLFALLIGMAFHFLHAEPRCGPGIELCA